MSYILKVQNRVYNWKLPLSGLDVNLRILRAQRKFLKRLC